MKRHKGLGFTLVELMVTVAIVALLASLAIPSFAPAIQKQRLKNAAQELQGQLYLAKAEAIKTGQRVYLSAQAGQAACYGFKVGAPCDCTSTDAESACSLLQVTPEAGHGVALALSSFSENAYIDPVRGAVQGAGRIQWKNSHGLTIDVGATRIGRIFACTPSANSISGFQGCE